MEKRLWGLFTGGQLTVIATAGLLCLAVPGGLWAAAKVQYSFVALYDPGSKQVAKLGRGGAVKVTSGLDPLTVSDGGGSLTVDGAVAEMPPSSLTRFFVSADGSGSACKTAFTVPAGQAFILSRLIVDTFSVTPAIGTYFEVGSNAPAGCIEMNEILVDNPSGVGAIDYDLAPGAVIPAGHALRVNTNGAVSGYIMGFGYFVPASAVAGAHVISLVH